jgi:hypothetical protein
MQEWRARRVAGMGVGEILSAISNSLAATSQQRKDVLCVFKGCLG